MRFKVYLAGAITGLSWEEVRARFREASELLSSIGYDVLNPLAGKGHLARETSLKATGYKHPTSTDRAIVGRDYWMVQQADIILCNLANSKSVSIGSVCELAWAYSQHKHVIVVMEQQNIHQHSFVKEMADMVFETDDEAYRYLRRLSAMGFD